MTERVDRDGVATRIADFVRASFPHDDAELSEATDLLNDWFIDSLGVVLTVAFLEEKFGIAVKRSDISDENFRNIGALAAFVVRRLGGRA